LSAEIKGKIEMEYGWFEKTNFLWKVLEEMFGSSNDMKSSSNILEKISSSSTLFDQSQEGQSSSQKEEAKSISLGKSDCPVFQTRRFSFAEQKMSYLKKMIALHQVPTSMTMMTRMMSMMNKNSWWSLINS
jgi:hypothetical protein